MKALTKNLSSNSEKEDFQEMFHTHDIDEKDLIDGKEFLENVRNRLITNDNGTLSHIFVDGFESNLGLMSSDFCQGDFLQISLGEKAHGFNRGMKAFYFKKTCIFYCIYTHLMI